MRHLLRLKNLRNYWANAVLTWQSDMSHGFVSIHTPVNPVQLLEVQTSPEVSNRGLGSSGTVDVIVARSAYEDVLSKSSGTA